MKAGEQAGQHTARAFKDRSSYSPLELLLIPRVWSSVPLTLFIFPCSFALLYGKQISDSLVTSFRVMTQTEARSEQSVGSGLPLKVIPTRVNV